MTFYDALAVLAALAVAALSPLLLRPVLERLGSLDVPNGRSSHSHPTLRGGGLAALGGLVAAVPFLILATGRGFTIAAIGVASAFALLGLVDDVRGLSARLRLPIQVVLGLLGGVIIAQLAGVSLWWAAVAMVGVAGYVNAVNFMDGANGISALHGAVVGAFLAYVGWHQAEAWLMVGGLLLAVAFGAFLPWNVWGAGMFLGDVGSYLLGAVLAMLAAGALAVGVPVLAALAPFAIYLADTGFTLLHRLLRRENLLEAHRSHFYQRLLVAGRSHGEVAATVTLFTVAAAVAGLASLWTGQWLVSVAGVMVVVLAYLATCMRDKAGTAA